MQILLTKILLNRLTWYSATTGLACWLVFAPVLGQWSNKLTAWAFGASAPAIAASVWLGQGLDRKGTLVQVNNHLGTQWQIDRMVDDINLGRAQFQATTDQLLGNNQSLPGLIQNLSIEGGPAGSLPAGEAYSPVCEALGRYGVAATEIERIKTAYFTRHVMRLDPKANGAMTKVNEIKRLAQELQLQMQADAPPLVTVASKGVMIDVPLPESERKAIPAESVIQPQARTHADDFVVSLGVGIDGEAQTLNLSDGTTPHALVAGTTGSGKTEFLRQLLYSAVTWYAPDVVGVAIIDPKRVAFNDFADYDGMLDKVAKSPDDVLRLLSAMVGEMERRYEILEQADCIDIQEYNRHDGKMCRILILLDEYSELLDQCDDDKQKVVEEQLRRIAQKARAAGIHLVLGTQKPVVKSSKTPKGIDTVLKANLPACIALKVRNGSDSRVVLDETGAENLLGKGDMLVRLAADTVRYQSPLLSRGAIAAALDKYGHAHPVDIVPEPSVAVTPSPELLNASLNVDITAALPQGVGDFLRSLCAMNPPEAKLRDMQRQLCLPSSADTHAFAKALQADGWGTVEQNPSHGRSYIFKASDRAMELFGAGS